MSYHGLAPMLVYGKVCVFFRSVAADDDRWRTRTSHVQRERGVSFTLRGNLIILAPPLVIGENELERALDIMDALLGELDFT